MQTGPSKAQKQIAKQRGGARAALALAAAVHLPARTAGVRLRIPPPLLAHRTRLPAGRCSFARRVACVLTAAAAWCAGTRQMRDKPRSVDDMSRNNKDPRLAAGGMRDRATVKRLLMYREKAPVHRLRPESAMKQATISQKSSI
jgi:hypothetical protein